MSDRSRKSGLVSRLMGAVGVAVVGVGFALSSSATAAAQPPVSFKAQVLPIFEQQCVSCHNPAGVGFKAIGLDLRSYHGLMAGSQFGTAVIRWHPELSPLIQVLEPDVTSYKNLKMPPNGPPLSSAQIDVISRWIQEGAKDN